MTKENKIWYQLYSNEIIVGYDSHLMSYSFKFLLKAAYHQYEQQKINRLYIEKHNFERWKRNIKPNVWHFFLDFSNGKSEHQWNVDGVIDMNKIRKKITQKG